MGVKTIHSNTQRTDNPILPTYWRRENEAIVLATGRNDVNNRVVSTEGSPTSSFPWKCTRTRRQAICEVREESFRKNGVTLKYFRKYLLSTFTRELDYD